MNCRGMTLIEVLIAGIILFIAIAAGSLVAKTNFLYQQRTAQTVEQQYQIHSVMEQIEYAIHLANKALDYAPQLWVYQFLLLSFYSKKKAIILVEKLLSFKLHKQQ